MDYDIQDPAKQRPSKSAPVLGPVTAGIAIGFFAALLLALPWIPGTWAAWKQASCLPDHCFCEEPRDSLLRQPMNTWSNFGFFLVGIYVLLTPSPKETQLANFENVYGVGCVFLGIMSGFFHTSLTFVGQWMDVMGMYLVINWAFTFNLVRGRHLSKMSSFLAIYMGLNVAFGIAQYLYPPCRRYLFAAMIFVFLISEHFVDRHHRSTFQVKYFYYGLASLATGFLIWILDNTKVVCFPDSYFQGHAIWHMLDSASTLFLMMFYRSERIIPNQFGKDDERSSLVVWADV